MEQISSSNLLILLFWAGAGAVALLIVVWILRWLLGVKEILNKLKDIRDELEAIREQQVTARSSFAAKPDVPEADDADVHFGASQSLPRSSGTMRRSV